EYPVGRTGGGKPSSIFRRDPRSSDPREESMKGWIRSTPAAIFGGLLLLLPTTVAAQIDPSLLGGLRARSIGPAGMSGRVVAIDAVASDPNIILVGAATGGVWKS